MVYNHFYPYDCVTQSLTHAIFCCFFFAFQLAHFAGYKARRCKAQFDLQSFRLRWKIPSKRGGRAGEFVLLWNDRQNSISAFVVWVFFFV